MEFRELKIERHTWGENKGKIIATLDIKGKNAAMTLNIGEPSSLRIMRACADIVADAGAEQAASFRREFLEAINTLGEKVKNG